MLVVHATARAGGAWNYLGGVRLREGLSTYLEPSARARSGNMPVEQYWRETVEGAPQGLPQAGDQALNHTHTWGRTYWGGATFWLIADVRIREATGRKRSLDDAI